MKMYSSDKVRAVSILNKIRKTSSIDCEETDTDKVQRQEVENKKLREENEKLRTLILKGKKYDVSFVSHKS